MAERAPGKSLIVLLVFSRRVVSIGLVRKANTYDFHLSIFYLQQIEPALPAILGHRSEHSFATGPVIPDPFISPLGLTMTPALSGKSERVSKKGASLVLTYLRSKGNGLLSF
jgi:hypothetical protein